MVQEATKEVTPKKKKRHAKGPEYERKFCRMLTEWITGKPDPVIFWRSAGSGSSATTGARFGRASNMDGDIISVDKKGQWVTDAFAIDIKSYSNFYIDTFFKMWEPKEFEMMERYLAALSTEKMKDVKKLGKSTPAYWWIKLCHEANRCNKFPMLVIKRKNYDEWMVITGVDKIWDSKTNQGVPWVAMMPVPMSLTGGAEYLTITRWSDFAPVHWKYVKGLVA